MWSHINLEKDLRIWLSHIRRNSMTHSNSRNNWFWVRLNCEKGWFSCFLPPRQATPFLSFVHIIIFHPLAQTKEAIYRMRLCLSRILWKRSLFLFSHSARFSPCTCTIIDLIIIYFHLEGGESSTHTFLAAFASKASNSCLVLSSHVLTAVELQYFFCLRVIVDDVVILWWCGVERSRRSHPLGVKFQKEVLA